MDKVYNHKDVEEKIYQEWEKNGYFTPEINYNANSSYSVYVYQSPDGVIATTGEEIISTYSWTFITGTGVLGAVPSGGVPTGVIPSGSEDPSGILPTSGVPTTLSVYRTSPQNMQPNVSRSLGSIDVTFNTFLYTDLAEISGYISVTKAGVLS